MFFDKHFVMFFEKHFVMFFDTHNHGLTRLWQKIFGNRSTQKSMTFSLLFILQKWTCLQIL